MKKRLWMISYKMPDGRSFQHEAKPQADVAKMAQRLMRRRIKGAPLEIIITPATAEEGVS